MLTHQERVDTAKSAIDYICGRSPEEQSQPVPNCPGWTVYNAASHVGRVAIAWKAMIEATPDDPESRNRGYAVADTVPEGTDAAALGVFAHQALNCLVDDPDAEAFFSMTGGHGTRRLWAVHAAAELGIHRLDVEAALGHDHAMSDDAAVDALSYSFEYFLPAMAKAAGEVPGSVTLDALGLSLDVGAAADDNVSLRGRPVDLLLALWGRPYDGVEVVSGEATVLEAWRSVPERAFQFGTWD